MAYQINGDDAQNRMQVKFSSYGQTGDLEVRSKGQISLFFVYMPISKIFMPNYVCVVQMKDTKHIRRDFHSVTLIMPKGWDFGALGVHRGSKNVFLKHGQVAYQIDGDDEQNSMHVTFSS